MFFIGKDVDQSLTPRLTHDFVRFYSKCLILEAGCAFVLLPHSALRHNRKGTPSPLRSLPPSSTSLTPSSSPSPLAAHILLPIAPSEAGGSNGRSYTIDQGRGWKDSQPECENVSMRIQ